MSDRPKIDFDRLHFGDCLFETAPDDAPMTDRFAISFANGHLWLGFSEDGDDWGAGEELAESQVDEVISVLTQWQNWRNS